MTRIPSRFTPLATLFAVALCSGATSAQLTTPGPTPAVMRTLVTPALVGSNRLYCTVFNPTASIVPLSQLQLVSAGQVLAAATCAGPASTLVPRQSCTVGWWPAAGGSTSASAVHCRARYTGNEGAVSGSLQAFLEGQAGTRPLAALALQPLVGVTPAP